MNATFELTNTTKADFPIAKMRKWTKGIHIETLRMAEPTRLDHRDSSPTPRHAHQDYFPPLRPHLRVPSRARPARFVTGNSPTPSWSES